MNFRVSEKDLKPVLFKFANPYHFMPSRFSNSIESAACWVKYGGKHERLVHFAQLMASLLGKMAFESKHIGGFREAISAAMSVVDVYLCESAYSGLDMLSWLPLYWESGSSEATPGLVEVYFYTQNTTGVYKKHTCIKYAVPPCDLMSYEFIPNRCKTLVKRICDITESIPYLSEHHKIGAAAYLLSYVAYFRNVSYLDFKVHPSKAEVYLELFRCYALALKVLNGSFHVIDTYAFHTMDMLYFKRATKRMFE